MTKREFFVVDDYGMGGIWMVFTAESADAIKARYPDLEVFESQPSFLTSKYVEFVRKTNAYDLDDPPTGYLAAIVAKRTTER